MVAISDMEHKYIIYRWAYAMSYDLGLGDTEYATVEDYIKYNNLLPEYTSRGWSEDECPVDILRMYNLEFLIDMARFNYISESIESLNSEDLVEGVYKFLNKRTRLSFKLDGHNIRLNYFNGKLVSVITRARTPGSKPKTLVNLMSMFIQEIPVKGKTVITGEIYLNSKTWEVYKGIRGVTSQRSAVSTAIANGDVQYLGYKVYKIYSDSQTWDMMDMYEVLESFGFGTPKHVYVNNYRELLKAMTVLSMFKGSYQAPSDGIVADNEDSQYALRINAWEEEKNESYVTGYPVNRGMYGDAILVSIRPIKLDNKTVYEIPVTNLQYVIDNNLRIGYPIAFNETSGVNSILDIERTEKLQNKYSGRYDEYRKEIDKLGQE